MKATKCISSTRKRTYIPAETECEAVVVLLGQTNVQHPQGLGETPPEVPYPTQSLHCACTLDRAHADLMPVMTC